MFYDWLLLSGQLVWNKPLLTVLLLVALVYVIFVIYFTKLKIYQPQPLLFFGSLAVLYVTIGSPLSALSHLTFSTHMVQMSILFFIFPPLCLLGIPMLFFEKISTIPAVKIFPKPFASLIIFAVLFLLYHVPAVLTFSMQYSVIQYGYRILLLALAFAMWRPIAARDQSMAEKKRFAFLSGLFLMPACLLFIVSAMMGGADSPYLTKMTASLCMPVSGYGSLPILPSGYHSQWDQVLAGVLMLGIHKVSILFTFRLGKRVQHWELEKSNGKGEFLFIKNRNEG
ncbi:cytochrome c oxidase assembly protein [Neobacillus mesonae]|uniref:cytochrome c oxidase assembly protein n=1 Tax=Neobacillus mesonae TaxID=1193713 RepID=UPI00203B18AC|nr:cytochrome c oxidase assembly protein [Neobacillus mesonae]MCM3567419.1 cytochrome c oxidase assembly protein [Neobacillus mesonae]